MDDDAYKIELRKRQLALVRWQQHSIDAGEKVVILFEGRDGAGKDGSIHALIEHMSAHATRVVALPMPADRERTQWYFQRYVPHLPAAGETAIFNRSWYNRAGVERVMGFCAPAELELFLSEASIFERQLTTSGIKLVKLWLDVSKKEQAERLKERQTEPLKALKASPMDATAQEKWDAYTEARDEMLRRTQSPHAPWIIVRADHKQEAHLAVLSCLVRSLAPEQIASSLEAPDPDILFSFDMAALDDGRLAS